MLNELISVPVKSVLRRFIGQRALHMSQAGQDFWVYAEAFNERKSGYFLDIGAHDGVYLSNTYILERRYGWNGICVEANPDTFVKLARNRRCTCINTCLDDSEGLVKFAKKGVMGGIISPTLDNRESGPHDEVLELRTQTLDNLLKEQNAPNDIDYLSIDIEGAEERVLGTLNFNEYRFKCITIERPSESLRKLFNENGYILIKEIPGLDCFYVHQSFLRHYKTNMFKCYDKKYVPVRLK